jgi:hypothetical protein
VRQEASPMLVLFVYRFQRTLIYVGLWKNNDSRFAILSQQDIERSQNAKYNSEYVFCLFLYLNFPSSVPLIRYNAAGAEQVFRTRPYGILQAVLETISS